MNISNSNVMIDLETLGTRPGSLILTLGAVFFDREMVHDYGHYEFYSSICKESSERCSMFGDRDTVLWWSKQSEEARTRAFEGKVPLPQALEGFEFFMARVVRDWGDPCVWGCGSDFDNVLLSAAYFKAGGRPPPWKHWNNRCYRTVKNMYVDIKMRRKGTHHHALDDAVSQAEHLLAMYKAHRGLKRRFRDAFKTRRPSGARE